VHLDSLLGPQEVTVAGDGEVIVAVGEKAPNGFVDEDKVLPLLEAFVQLDAKLAVLLSEGEFEAGIGVGDQVLVDLAERPATELPREALLTDDLVVAGVRLSLAQPA